MTLTNNLPILYKIKILIHRFLTRKLCIFQRESYAQVGEDRILQALCPKIGFYVEVGANHPLRCSNTFLLYLSGWRGIAIDANESLISLFKKIRPLDQSIHALVSNKVTEEEFVELKRMAQKLNFSFVASAIDEICLQ